MKAAILDELGAMPRFGDFDEPRLDLHETLVHVSAAAIKPLDRAIAAGVHYSSPRALPVVCGVDGVGRLDDGSRVYFSSFRQPFGAMAERAAASWTVPVPEGLSDAQAAAIVNPALAAWLPLVWRGRLEKGETVLIVGATGAAGSFAVRAARLLGAGKVIAAGRRQDVLATLGADATIDLRLPEAELGEAFRDHAADGIGVVVDYVWGRTIEILIDSLIKADLSVHSQIPTRLVSVGEMGGRTITLPSSALRSSRLEITGSGSGNFPPIAQMQDIVADILAHAAAGRIALDVETFALADVAAAWQAAGAGAARPVLVPG